MIAALMLAIGVFCLLADIGRIDRVAMLFLQPTVSYLTLGTYALTLLLITSIVLAVIWLMSLPPSRRWIVRILNAFVMVAAIAVMLYAGLLIQSMGTGLLIGSPLIPMLFVLSSLSLGAALIFSLFVSSGHGRLFLSTLVQLMHFDRLIIILELIALTALIIYAWLSPAFFQTALLLLEGSEMIPFWLGFIACGFIIPFVLETVMCSSVKRSERNLNTQILLAAVVGSTFIGGFSLRWFIVVAGLPVFNAPATLIGG